MVQIEAGKLYRARDGRKVGPMRPDDDEFLTHNPNAMRGFLWRKDGGRFFGIDRGGPSDLIAEWTDEPTGPVRVVTVPASTRKEIVPGTHDRVRVGWGDKTTNVSISVDPRTKGCWSRGDPARRRSLAACE